MKTSAAMSIFTKIGEKYREWKQHPVGKVLLNKYFVVGFIFLVWICFLDTNNVGQMIRARVTLGRQQRQIEFYKREISNMDRKLQQLRSERDSLEKFAREEYYYHQDGEDVYVIE
ncbi:MAG: septum formation initiator family protein [Bacteroidales bacterium]|nr:septum formation initiator family protein [Bacteroidales bacterium]MBQ1831454.1 septum formation initiator family protein [Bacteroidales bacterium]MBQ2149487.1 septum formation initiator family protein [Bacteroidales bacterium]MBQ2195059.1 septum formation initiator family protein [Bacteroidales bacterium]MBQ4222169.1 septum formation initiator family protein [Bacteroidales bacterium]